MNTCLGTLFIVDDDPQSRKAVAALATSMKIKCEIYESAEAFLAHYNSSQTGCALVDYRLGGMDGLQLQESLRAINGNLAVILVSAYADVSLVVRALKNGAVAFIEKPYQDDELADALRRALDRGAHVEAPTAEPGKAPAATKEDKETNSALMRRSEDLLVEYARTGNRLAFEELVHRFERELYSYLRGRIGDSQLAEDAFQATFLQLHLKCHQFEPDRRLRPWLYTIANNQAIDLLRRNKRHKAISLNRSSRNIDFQEEHQSLGDLLEATDAGPSERLETAENCQYTRLALAKIPAKLREVLDLVAYQGLKHREVAEVLGIPVGTVKSRLNKATRCLHKALIALSSRSTLGNPN